MNKTTKVLKTKWWTYGGGFCGAVAVKYQNGWRAYIAGFNGNNHTEDTEEQSIDKIVRWGAYLEKEVAEAIFKIENLSYIEKTRIK